jgi:hypothetical protein
MQYANKAAEQLKTLRSITIMVDSWTDRSGREVTEILAKCDEKILSLNALYAKEQQTGSVVTRKI